MLTTYRGGVTSQTNLAHEGRLLDGDPEGGSEVWRLAAAARNRFPERPGVPPARHYDLAARSSLYGSGGNAGEGSAAPGPKSPRWSAERRASLQPKSDISDFGHS